MNNSSAPLDCSITSSDSVGYIAQEISTITLSNSSDYYCSADSDTIIISTSGTSMGCTIGSNMINNPSMTISSNGNVGIGTTTISSSSFNWKTEEFVNCLPDYNRIQKMCKEYPGLAIAFEKFKNVYKIVKDDYDTPKDKRPKP